MKKIGHGWQVNVYDLGNGRVLKKRKGALNTYITAFIDSGFRALYKEKVSKVIQNYFHSLKHLDTIIKNTDIDTGVLGNPEIDLVKYNYTQNKVMPLKNYISEINKDDFLRIMHECTTLTKYLWKYGIYESVSNLDRNCGIDEKGKLILLDLGELVFTKEEVEKSIKNRRWTKSYFYKRVIKKSKWRKEYEDIFDKELTLESLGTLWNTASF